MPRGQISWDDGFSFCSPLKGSLPPRVWPQGMSFFDPSGNLGLTLVSRGISRICP